MKWYSYVTNLTCKELEESLSEEVRKENKIYESLFPLEDVKEFNKAVVKEYIDTWGEAYFCARRAYEKFLTKTNHKEKTTIYYPGSWIDLTPVEEFLMAGLEKNVEFIYRDYYRKEEEASKQLQTGFNFLLKKYKTNKNKVSLKIIPTPITSNSKPVKADMVYIEGLSSIDRDADTAKNRVNLDWLGKKIVDGMGRDCILFGSSVSDYAMLYDGFKKLEKNIFAVESRPRPSTLLVVMKKLKGPWIPILDSVSYEICQNKHVISFILANERRRVIKNREHFNKFSKAIEECKIPEEIKEGVQLYGEVRDKKMPDIIFEKRQAFGDLRANLADFLIAQRYYEKSANYGEEFILKTKLEMFKQITNGNPSGDENSLLASSCPHPNLFEREYKRQNRKFIRTLSIYK